MTSTGCSRRCGPRACGWTRKCRTRSTGSSAGSWIPRAIESSCGSRRQDNEERAMSPKKAPKKAERFTAEERAAMKERVKEMKGGVEGEAAVLAKIATMREPDRAMAKRVHAIVMAAAPGLTPRLWYGMPAYEKDDKGGWVFQDANKFKASSGAVGLSERAKRDAGRMWPTAFALRELNASVEAAITALVRRAV